MATEKLYALLSEKEKTEKLAIEIMDSLIPDYSGGTSHLDEYEQDLDNYRLYNNIVDQRQFESYCNPLGIEIDQFMNEIRPYNKTYTQIDVLLGEELKRGDTFRTLLVSESDLEDKDQELRDVLAEGIKGQIQQVMAEIQFRNGEMTEEEFEQRIQQLQQAYPDPTEVSRTGFMSSLEIATNEVLEHAKFSLDIASLKNEGFFHALISDKELTYVGVYGGFPSIRILNPLNTFFFKGSETKYIEDGQAAGNRSQMTVSEVLEIYGSDMKDKDLDDFIERHSHGTDDYVGGKPEMFYGRDKTMTAKYWRHMFKDSLWMNYEGQYGEDYMPFTTNWNAKVWVTHVEWKWFRKVGFLYTFNEYGEKETTIVSDKYDFPRKNSTAIRYTNQYGRKNTKFVWEDEFGEQREIEFMWIPRIWEGTRIDENIYVNVREKPFQAVSAENPFNSCKLGYHGRRYNAVNAKSISMMGRMKPFQFLYFIAAHQFAELVSKNIGPVLGIDTSQIDTNLAGDEGSPLKAAEKTMWYMFKGFNVYNSMQNEFGSSPTNLGRPSPGKVENASTTADLMNLTNILTWLEFEIGKAAGISPQRAAQFSPNTNVTDNRQAITQSAHMTEKYNHQHDKTWANILNSYVRVFAEWAKAQFESDPTRKSIKLQYMLSDQSMKTLLLTPDITNISDIGIFVSNSGADESYMKKMEELSMTMIQHEAATSVDISNILKSRAQGTSPEAVHRQLEIAKTRREQREDAVNQQQSELMQKQAAQAEEYAEREHQRQIELIQVKAQLDKETKLAVEQAKALSDTDINNNRVPDILEISKLQADLKKNDRAAKQKDKELELKEREVALKEKIEPKKLNKPNKTK